MKRVFSLLMLLLAGALVLAGCGGGQTAVSPTTAPEPEVATANEGESEQAVAVEHDPYNLTMIGNTGRPQFLNAYASW